MHTIALVLSIALIPALLLALQLLVALKRWLTAESTTVLLAKIVTEALVAENTAITLIIAVGTVVALRSTIGRFLSQHLRSIRVSTIAHAGMRSKVALCVALVVAKFVLLLSISTLLIIVTLTLFVLTVVIGLLIIVASVVIVLLIIIELLIVVGRAACFIPVFE